MITLKTTKKQTKYGELYFNISSLYFSCEAKDYYLKIQKTRDTKKEGISPENFMIFSPPQRLLFKEINSRFFSFG